MRILFQGDSITDAGREKGNDVNFGLGYPLLVKANLGFEKPNEYEFFNRGVSGDRIVDIYARIKSDIINIKPDVMSILVGVNDAMHEFAESPNGVDPDTYYKIYDMLIEDVKRALPHIKIIIMEPFVLKGSITSNKWETVRAEVEKRAEMARKISEKHNLAFIPLQHGFDELANNDGKEYWALDGVHPTTMGHEYIKNEWIKAFKNLKA